MPKNSDCAENILDPERLLAWGSSQLKKIDKERKKKKSNTEKEDGSVLTNKKNKIKVFYTEEEEKKKKKKKVEVYQEPYEEKQKKRYTQKVKNDSESIDRDCSKMLELNECEDTVYKSKKKDKCESVCVNIELKKSDVSYETNFSNTHQKKRKKNEEDSDSALKKIKKNKKKKKKDYISEYDKNLSKNEESYTMCIKVTKLNDSDNTTKDNVNEILKSKYKQKKKQGENVGIKENEFLLPKKNKKHKRDRSKESMHEESNSDISNHIERIPKKKRKSKKIKEHGEEILSDVNKVNNDLVINKDTSGYTKEKKNKKRKSLEIEEADIQRVHKKKKIKEKIDYIELNTSSEITHVSDSDLVTSSSLKKKKKKKSSDIIEDIPSEIQVKKKKKNKREKHFYSLDESVQVNLLAKNVKTEKTRKVGMKFGKSPISRLLTNREICSSCCVMHTTCSKNICSNKAVNSVETEANSSANRENKPNEGVNNPLRKTGENLVIKQEKIDPEFQKYCLSPNITIKQEKIDEPQLCNTTDVRKGIDLNHNIQIKQEKCDITVSHSSNCEENTQSPLQNNVTNVTNGHKQNTENLLPDSASGYRENTNVIFHDSVRNSANGHEEITESILQNSVINNASGHRENSNIIFCDSVRNSANGHKDITKDILQSSVTTRNDHNQNTVNILPNSVINNTSSHRQNTIIIFHDTVRNGDNGHKDITEGILQNNVTTSSENVSSDSVTNNASGHREIANFILHDGNRHKEIAERVLHDSVTNHASCTHESENVEHNNISNIPLLSNRINTENNYMNKGNCYLNENQNMQTHLEYNKPFYMDSCENFYNFHDNKLTIHEEINAVQNDLLGKESEVMNSTSHDMKCKTENLHPNPNGYATSVIDSEEVSKEKMYHNNYNKTSVEENSVNHTSSPITGNVVESFGLDYIPLSNTKQCSDSHNNTNTRTVLQQNSEIHVRMHQQLLQSDQYYQSPNENGSCNQHWNHIQSEHHQIPPANKSYNRLPKSVYDKKKSPQNYNTYFDNRQLPLTKSLLFSCVRPQFKSKEQVSQILKVDVSQIELCYYRLSSKFCQDVHVKFFHEKHFQNVIRYNAKKVRCKSWYVKCGDKKNMIQRKKM